MSLFQSIGCRRSKRELGKGLYIFIVLSSIFVSKRPLRDEHSADGRGINTHEFLNTLLQGLDFLFKALPLEGLGVDWFLLLLPPLILSVWLRHCHCRNKTNWVGGLSFLERIAGRNTQKFFEAPNQKCISACAIRGAIRDTCV